MATRLWLVGGFLGAGKTTLLLQTAHLLTEQGYRVGLITNDQAQDLVDTAMARAQDIPVMEVSGGCFCCNFPDLLTSIQQLQERIQPDVILGEPVGSCTDLISTIFRPLHKYYPGQFQVAPLTVLIDPLRDPESFPREVEYIYDRQLTEANIIALSKSDLFDPDTARQQVQQLQERYPKAQIIRCSAKTGEGLQTWIETCLQQSSDIGETLEMNYETYAQGEAHLGWLNATATLHANPPFLPIDWIERFFRAVEHGCVIKGAAVAHIKIHLTTSTDAYKVSLTQLGRTPSWDLRPAEIAVDQANFILNARVGTTPPILEEIVRQALAQVTSSSGMQADLTHLECFSPLPPRPTHRLLQL